MPSLISATTPDASAGRGGAALPQKPGSGAPTPTKVGWAKLALGSFAPVTSPTCSTGRRSQSSRTSGGVRRLRGTHSGGATAGASPPAGALDQPTLSQPAAMHPTGPQARSRAGPPVMG